MYRGKGLRMAAVRGAQNNSAFELEKRPSKLQRLGAETSILVGRRPGQKLMRHGGDASPRKKKNRSKSLVRKIQVENP